MKKILLLLLSVIMVWSMAACGETKEKEMTGSEATVAGFLEAIKQSDHNKINEYVVENDKMYLEDKYESMSETDVILASAEYDIKEIKELEDGSAVVTVEVTSADMIDVLQTYSENVLTVLSENKDEKEQKEALLNALKEAIEQNKGNIVTKTVDLEVVQIEGMWKIKSTDKLIILLTTGTAVEEI